MPINPFVFRNAGLDTLPISEGGMLPRFTVTGDRVGGGVDDRDGVESEVAHINESAVRCDGQFEQIRSGETVDGGGVEEIAGRVGTVIETPVMGAISVGRGGESGRVALALACHCKSGEFVNPGGKVEVAGRSLVGGDDHGGGERIETDVTSHDLVRARGDIAQSESSGLIGQGGQAQQR